MVVKAKANLHFNWSFANGKIRKSWERTRKGRRIVVAVTFNLLPKITCPSKGECRNFCYACKGNFTYPAPMRTRRENQELVESYIADGSFFARMNADIAYLRGIGIEVIRLHDSGDFYSREYINSWVEVMEANNDILFYAYTKSHYGFHNIPRNFKLIQSYGGKNDNLINTNKPHALIFHSLAELKAAGYIDCHSNDAIAAKAEVVRVGLLAH